MSGDHNHYRGLDMSESANSYQVQGNHYRRLEPQPWDVIAAWDLNFFEGNCLKYLSRWKEKNGVDDLKKARHYLDKLIEIEQARCE